MERQRTWLALLLASTVAESTSHCSITDGRQWLSRWRRPNTFNVTSSQLLLRRWYKFSCSWRVKLKTYLLWFTPLVHKELSWKMPSSWMWSRMPLVKSNVSEECSLIFFFAIRSTETSILTRATLHHIQDDCVLRSQPSKNWYLTQERGYHSNCVNLYFS